jgi:hypothetical protein
MEKAQQMFSLQGDAPFRGVKAVSGNVDKDRAAAPLRPPREVIVENGDQIV